MHCTAPLFDYSHFEPPQRFLAPKDNPLVPPRVDRGESKERPSCLEKESARLSLLHLLAPAMSNVKDKRMKKASSEVQVSRKVTVSSADDRPRKSEKSSRASAIKHSLRSFRPRSSASTTSETNITRNPKSPRESPRDRENARENSMRERAISSASPVTELQKVRMLQADIHLRLKELEGIVARLQDQLESATDDTRSKLEEQLTEQVTLLSALRMHAKIMDDRHEEGYLEMRVANANSVSADDSVLSYNRYWFYLNFPHFCCYDNQQDDNPSGVITLSMLMQVIPTPNDKKAFTVIPDKGYSIYQFRAENAEIATRWMRAICKSAEIPLGKREKESATLKSPRLKEQRDSPRSMITRVKDAFRSEYSSRECIASDLDEFTTWCDISDQFKTQAFEDQEKQIFYRVSGGTREDILYWIFYFFPLDAAVKSSSSRTVYCEELAAFLNSSPFYCLPDQVVSSLTHCWNYFTENGFPPSMGAVGMQSRLYYIARQWLLSDSVYEDIVEEMEARKQLKDFVVGILDRDRRDKIAATTFVQVLENKGTEMQYLRPDNYVASTRNELIECEVEEVAAQLTVAAALLFSKINKRELMSFLRGDEGGALTAVSDVNEYNSKLVRWTITLILNAPNPKAQLELYKKLYRIAKRLFDLNNYNDCSSILEGLLDVSVQSLQGLQELLSQRIIQKIRKLAIIFSPLSDYARFRELPSKEGHLIPFMEYELQRLLRVEHESPSFLPQSNDNAPPLLNLQKMVALWKAVGGSSLCRASLVDYTTSILIDPSLQKLIHEVNPLDYDELNKLSIAQEPTRNVRSVLEMEIAERDAEIEELRGQQERHERDKLQVARDLGLDLTTLRPSRPLTPAVINQEQLDVLLSLLATERARSLSRE